MAGSDIDIRADSNPSRYCVGRSQIRSRFRLFQRQASYPCFSALEHTRANLRRSIQRRFRLAHTLVLESCA
jgi:hypothetical protein